MTNPNLTSLENVKGWMGIAGTADDTLLERLITACSSFIQNWINRTIASQEYTETRNGNGGRSLSFLNYPVTSVSSVLVDGREISGYVFSPTQLMLNGSCFTRGFQNVSITYMAGFATIPTDIEQACIELCALRYKERDRIGQMSKSIAGEVVSFSQKDMSEDIKTLLQQYKRVITA